MMLSKRNRPTVAFFVALVSVVHAVPAAAGDAPKLTEAAVTESPPTLIPELRSGTDENYVEIYGQINKGLLVFDDGGPTLGYFPVDNGNSSSRGGLRIYSSLGNGWSLGGNLEAEWNPYSTNNVNQLNHGDYDWDTTLLRKAEIYLDFKPVGRVWLGQGSMASDSTAEVDFSGTSVVGYSLVSDMAGGSFFRVADGALSSVHVKDAFTNFDGVGRKLRVRYDTPTFIGFSLATSVGTQVVPDDTGITVWDVAVRYETTIEDYKVAAAVAFSKPDEDESLVDGSISLLQEPTGLSLTLAAAYSDEETADGRYGYAKLGYQTNIFQVGKTAFAVDAYFGEDIAGEATDSRSLGAQVVQHLDYLQTELYLGARRYTYEEATTDFDDSFAVLAGARIKF